MSLLKIRAGQRFYLYAIILIPLVLLLLAVILEYSDLDLLWESQFYDAGRQLWPYKSHWFFNGVIHTGGQYLDKLLAVFWLVIFVVVNVKKELRSYRKIMLYFLVATALGPALVGFLKAHTHIYTPWDLQIFNGKEPHLRIFDHVPQGLPVGHAFPAGHSSGGFCFVSLYFVFLRYRSRLRIYGLLFGVALGLIFGLGQQVRGAHFPSHDLVTLAICWYISLGMYFIFYPKEWTALQNETELAERRRSSSLPNQSG